MVACTVRLLPLEEPWDISGDGERGEDEKGLVEGFIGLAGTISIFMSGISGGVDWGRGWDKEDPGVEEIK